MTNNETLTEGTNMTLVKISIGEKIHAGNKELWDEHGFMFCGSAKWGGNEPQIIENSDNSQDSTEATSNSNNNESVSEPDETAEVDTEAITTSEEEVDPIEDPILELLPPVPGNNIFTGAA